MAQPIAIRRAAIYRQCAQQLTEIAAHLRDEGDRKHLRNLVATFQRAADAMAPASEPAERDEALGEQPQAEPVRRPQTEREKAGTQPWPLVRFVR